jgi:hypothetical protein
MVAASRNGDGADDIEIDDEISNRSAVASSIRRRSRGMVLFVLVTDSFFRAFCLKAFLSMFLDWIQFLSQALLTKQAPYIQSAKNKWQDKAKN